MVLITHCAIMIENNGYHHPIGRLDQYLYPFYKKALDEGQSEEYLMDLLHEFKIRFEEMWYLRSAGEAEAYPGCALYMHIVLGGVKADGTDACNELTRFNTAGNGGTPDQGALHIFPLPRKVDEETFPPCHEGCPQRRQPPQFFNDGANILSLQELGSLWKRQGITAL